jgi:uncharacterized surface protein with fasciclin (FAS1) repeats
MIATPTNSKVAAKHNIIENALAAGSFNTLCNAIEVAGLVGAFKGAGPLTVFAPTDEAFNKLPAGTLEELLKDKNRLVSMIKSHVLPSKLMSKDIISRSSKTIQGNSLNVVSKDGKVTIDDANITAADIESSNGVLHGIDTVVMPM